MYKRRGGEGRGFREAHTRPNHRASPYPNARAPLAVWCQPETKNFHRFYRNFGETRMHVCYMRGGCLIARSKMKTPCGAMVMVCGKNRPNQRYNNGWSRASTPPSHSHSSCSFLPRRHALPYIHMCDAIHVNSTHVGIFGSWVHFYNMPIV